MNQTQRCAWVSDDALYVQYHDQEWGVPIFNDTQLFEFLILEGAQAGLSWLTVLKKRDHYRRCFDQFNAEKMARYTDARCERLMQDAGIIRHRLKIQAARTNAQAFLKVLETYPSFSAYIWQFVEGKPLHHHWRKQSDVPVRTLASDEMSKDLKRRGFKFVGTTICYAYMQAVGMVNDHIVSCFRHAEVNQIKC